MTTKTKVAFARLLYQGVRHGRRLGGWDGDHAVVERRGLRWALDLHEGIDLSIFLFGAFERSTVDLLRRLAKKDDVVLDIGANIGAHTLPLAQGVGPGGVVIAFEPTDFAFSKLKRNLALNPSLEPIVRTEQLFLVDKPGAAVDERIYSSWPLNQSEGVHEKLRAKAMETTNARAERLDDYALRTGMQRLNLIKLDVDGHESQVLLGAQQVLKQFRPQILMELSPYIHRDLSKDEEDPFAILIRFLGSAGYAMRSVDSGRQLPFDPAFLQKLVPDGSGINVVLSPVDGGR